jgi:hypothetical protein
LVKELRRAGARTLEEANQVLSAYLPRFNALFARPAAERQHAYRRLPPHIDLDGILSFHYVRTVANDNTVRLEERLVHIEPGPGGRSYAGCRVELQEQLDGSLTVLYKGHVIATQPRLSDAPLRNRRRKRGRELPELDKPKREPRPAARLRPTPSAAPIKPASTHPWRRWVVTKSQAR